MELKKKILYNNISKIKILKLIILKFLKYMTKNGKFSTTKNLFYKIFLELKILNYNPYLIILNAIFNSLPFFEYRSFNNKKKGKGKKRIKKKNLKISFNPLIINKKRQILLGLKTLKKYNYENTKIFSTILIYTALNKGPIIENLKLVNKNIFTNFYRIQSEKNKKIYN